MNGWNTVEVIFTSGGTITIFEHKFRTTMKLWPYSLLLKTINLL